MEDKIILELDIPSECARKLVSGEADLGLVPVAVIPKVKDAQILSRFCIGADGPVRSVTLLSEVPLHEIRSVYLDYQSRTSVALTKILASRFWDISPVWEEGQEGFETNIRGTSAGVVIGDRSLQMRDSFPFVYDLSEEWKKMTGLPFVFACWVSNKPLADEFVRSFNDALQNGIDSIETVINELPQEKRKGIDAVQYLKKDISYELDESKRKAVELFLGYLAEMPG